MRHPGRAAPALPAKSPRVAVRGSGGRGPESAELRCGCGSLLARLLQGELELKCRRCKRVVVLDLALDPEGRASEQDLRAALGTELRCTCGDGAP